MFSSDRFRGITAREEAMVDTQCGDKVAASLAGIARIVYIDNIVDISSQTDQGRIIGC